MSNDAWGFETRQIHAGASVDPPHRARNTPIYQTSSFVFEDSAHGARLFALQEPGNIYTRIMNPTQAVFEARMASLEGGIPTAAGGMVPGALAVGSGQAAETIAILNLAEAGDHIVSSASLYGGTYNLFHYTLPKMGIEVSFVENPDDIGEWRSKIRPNTKALYGETIPNPKNDVLDIEPLAALAEEVGAPLIVDNTIASPYLCNPIKHGAHIVVHSATKFIGGHGSAIGGVIVDAGTFDFGKWADKFPNYNQPDPSYHGLNYWPMLGPGCFIVKARIQLLRDLGASTTPFNSWLFITGLETLSLRMERHVANAQKVAEFLAGRDEVAQVLYAGLPSSPYHAKAQKYLPRGAGSVLAFEIKGGAEAGQRFADALELHSNLANIGDVRSLVIHPASTTHSQLTPEEMAASGVTPGMIRLSVGIESIEDILADLEAGFRAAKG
ncbi:MAG: bifunctional o-acetylhomoserine/o-acetylserine sulfhydrylase [Acidimicrobiales bacterium]|nr:bifunctional o-acetylhomoserine/o-acetylserine sulfhydrylase [Acidimicrobiales bacterium]